MRAHAGRRGGFVGPVLVGACLLLAACAAEVPRDRELLLERTVRDNVVVVLLDAAAAAHFSFLGSERDSSPHLARIAAESVVFEQAYAQASATPPSVLAPFTSRFPWPEGAAELHGEIGTMLPEDVPAMHRLLAGRYRQRLGVSASSWISDRFGYGQGFTEFREIFGGDSGAIGPESALQVADATCSWIEQQGDEPFFAYVHFYQPHAPYDPPAPFDGLFEPQLRGHGDGSNEGLQPFRRLVPPPPVRDNVVALYDGNIAFVDAQVQRIVATLQERDLWERTIFVLVSDHGEAFWQHGTRGHGLSAYEEYVRVPFVVRVPALAARPKRVRTPVQLMDLLPTLLELARLPVPATGLSGRSLVGALLEGDAGLSAETVISRNHEMSDLQLAIRRGDWKLIQRVTPEHFELFDLAADPSETRNLLEGAAVGSPRWQIASTLAIELSKHIDHAKRQWGSSLVAPDSLDAATTERLKAMGYLN